MVNVTSSFTSGLKKMVANSYFRDHTLLWLFEDYFDLSEEEICGEEAEGTYTYLGSQVLDPDTFVALRSTVVTDSFARSVAVDHLLCLEKRLSTR